MKRYTITAGTGFDKDGRAISARVVLLALVSIRALLASLFGGYSESNGTGGWINGHGDLVTEENVTFTIVTDAAVNDAMQAAESVARLLNQESVLFTEEDVNSAFIAQKVTA